MHCMIVSKIKSLVLFVFVVMLTGTLQAQKDIDLVGWQQNHIPEKFAKNLSIESIDLSNSQIQKLPEWLPLLPNLKTLILNGTINLKPLEAAKIIAQCPSLTTLSWQSANLIFMPIPLIKSTSIEKLDLSNNGIFEFPKGFEKLPLVNLNISNNLIDSLPSEILKMKKIVTIDFSYNTGTVNSYNYILLAKLSSLKKVSIQGAFYLPNTIGLLTQIESLNLAHGNFNTVPKELNNLSKIEALDISDCKQLQLDLLFDQISNWKILKTIHLGHFKMNRIPYNINKLYGLKKVSIWNSCIEELPSSFTRLNLNTIEITNSKIINPEQVFKQVSKINSLKNITLKNITFGTSEWEAKLYKLDTLIVKNSNLTELHFKAKKIKYVDFSGNQVLASELKELNSYTLIGGISGEKIKYNSAITKDKILKEDSSLTVFKKKIYASVGEIFNLPNNIEVNVPKNGFLDINHKVVKGDVVMHFTFVKNAEELLKHNFPLHLKNNIAIDFKYIIKIEAYCEGKKVYLNQQSPITLKIFFPENKDFNAYLYDYNQLRWEQKPLTSNACNLNSIEPLSDDFKAFVLENYVTKQSSNSGELNRANVYFKLKHNRRKNTLNFDMKPEYKYKSSYNLLTNNTLAYPELKTYQNIRWNYVGDEVITDLTSLVMLDPEPEPEKINRKSTFTFTTNQIYDIYISPNPNKDNYLLKLLLANDTITLEVIPYLTIIKPKKIQKWHKKRFTKYQKRLSKRVTQWSEMDSSYFNDKYKFQQKLQKASMLSYDSLSKKEININHPTSKVSYSISIDKTGWIGIGKNAVINSPITIRPEFYISDKKNYSKECLVYDISTNLFYWSSSSEITVNQNGKNMVYFLIGNAYIYSAPIHKESSKINLQKQ